MDEGIRIFQEVIRSDLGELLSKKHLYQQVQPDQNVIDAYVEKEATAEKNRPRLPPTATGSGQLSNILSPPRRDKAFFLRQFETIALKRNWVLHNPKTTPNLPDDKSFGLGALPFHLPTPVRLHCTRCEANQPFHPNGDGQAISCQPKASAGVGSRQVFVLNYECQNGCGESVVFLVTREGQKLQLSGRSVLEVVPTPKVIPKNAWINELCRGQPAGQL